MIATGDDRHCRASVRNFSVKAQIAGVPAGAGWRYLAGTQPATNRAVGHVDLPDAGRVVDSRAFATAMEFRDNARH